MNKLQEEINKFGGWENYHQYLLNTYGETKQQKEAFIKRTHTPEIQSYRGRQNTTEQQSIKGKIGGLANSSEQQRIKALKNTSEQQSIKGKKSGEKRHEGSNEQLKPWEDLGISRSWYYNQKKLGFF